MNTPTEFNLPRVEPYLATFYATSLRFRHGSNSLALRGREAGRSSGAGVDQIRVRAQPQDCQSARSRRATVAARPRRRNHRVSINVRYWPIADIPPFRRAPLVSKMRAGKPAMRLRQFITLV